MASCVRRDVRMGVETAKYSCPMMYGRSDLHTSFSVPFHCFSLIRMQQSYNSFIHIYPLVPVAIAFIAGIMLGHNYLYAYSWSFSLIPFAVSLACIFLFRKSPVAQTSAILLSILFAGVSFTVLAEHDADVTLPDGDFSYEGVIASEPVERGRTVRFDLLVASGPLCGRSVRVSLLKDTVQRHYAALGVGHGFKATSRLKAPSNFDGSNFDYVTYLKCHGIVAETFVYYNSWRSDSVSLQRLSLVKRARIAALDYRRLVLERYRDLGLDGQNMAVVAAMTLGDKSGISHSTRDTYSITGASHILALSGLHLAVVYVLLSMFSLGGRLYFVRECILLSSIWAYVFLVGMSPSVVRAAIMITVYATMSLAGRERASVNTLALAAIVMLVVNPLTLYDIGFQLSFAAVAFILVFQPMVGGIVSYRFLQRHRLVGYVWQSITISLVAQGGTAPLIAYYFGRLPVYFLLTNLVAIPAATVIIYGSATMLALWFVPVLQQLVAWIVQATATILNRILETIASWPNASIDGLHVSTVQVVLSYVAIACAFLIFGVFERHFRREAGLWGRIW